MDVGCLQSVAVHGGVVEGRDVVVCEGVLGEHLPDCAQQGSVLGFQRVEVAQDAFECVFDVEHGFAVVAVAVTACVSPFGMIRVSVFCVSVGVLGVCGHATSCWLLGISVIRYVSICPHPRRLP